MSYSKMSTTLMTVLAVVLMVVATTTEVAEAQQNDCVNKLIPCANYINTTGTPPSSCCDSLKEAVTTQLSCICNLYSTPGLLQQLQINVTEALLLPGRCGIPGDLSACGNASGPTSSSVPPPPPVAGNDGNSLRGLSWAGLPTLFLVWAFTVLY